ncbi:MAG: prolyl oligopeptidase family serine peptidase [Firmicutes bacterium]|nr:prolyl oligopeptidase family serine peptidase [Bacillota bacterium]
MRKKLYILLFALAIFSICAVACTAGGTPSGNYQTHSSEIYLDRGDSTYSFAEAVYPLGINQDMPLVVIAHGFSGTLNSGGAEELAHKLAAVGIASVRVDFNPRISPEKNSERTFTYNLKSMEKDMLLAIDYMLSHFEIDQDRIGLYGRSMGGRVAMIMANESSGLHDYKALALVAPAGNETAMIDYMGGQSRWEEMKQEALTKGYVECKGLKLTSSWFEFFEEYNPCVHGDNFTDKPVLVICNTLDNVVTEATSKECASAYKNSQVIEVTTDNYHGYEMGYKESELKDYLMTEITDFFISSL